jgi:PAS domain S-box-containing protein
VVSAELKDNINPSDAPAAGPAGAARDLASSAELATPSAAVEPRPASPPHARRRARFLLRGESAVASIGIALSAILLAAIAGASYWMLTEQRAAWRQSRTDQVRIVGELLADASESMLAHDELSSVRRLIAQTGRTNDLACRIVLSDGRVLASSDVAEINVQTMPEAWDRTVLLDEQAATSDSPDTVSFARPIRIGTRGGADVRVMTGIGKPLWSFWEAQTGVAAIGAIALVATLFVYRRVRWQLRAMGAVSEALMAAAHGERSAATLMVGADLGPEGAAWNALVSARDQLGRRDVAERAREALGRRGSVKGDLNAACDAMSQGLIIVDEQNRISYANGAAAVFLHTGRDALAGTPIDKVLQVETVLEAVREVTSGLARRRTVLDVERKGEDQAGVFRFTVRPVRREDGASAMITVEDITQQKVAEEARNSFVAQATHELRTPLTNIRLYVESAIEDGEQDPALRSKALNVINGETRRLERIVGEMLSVAEIEAGSFKLKSAEVRLDTVFEELRHDYEEQAKAKNITLAFNLPPKLPNIRADRDKVMLALHNLVGNGLKYTSDGGSVTINVVVDADTLTVSVTDTGIGISPEDAEKVFERFYRAKDTRVSKITGTGLGLTIAREVVRLHGGDISVESQLNKGSTFTMTLPVKAGAA